jgi:tetratricopeptide (TPR) repeat protein
MTESLNALREARQREDLHAMSIEARRLNEAAPDLKGGWGEVARIALDAGDTLAAVAAAGRLMEALPDSADARLWMVAALSEAEDFAGAIQTLQPLYDADPRDGALSRRLGFLLLDGGAAETAEQAFRQALAADGRDALAWEGLSRAKTFASGDDDLALMEEARLGYDEAVPAEQRGILSYAIAKAYEDLGELDIAARRAAEGAAFYRASAPFDTAYHEAGVGHILSVFDETLKGAGQGVGADDDRPVFIIAPPGAGARWVARTLAAGEGAFALPRGNGLFWMSGAALGDHSLEAMKAALAQPGDDNAVSIVGRNYLSYAGEWAGEATRIIDPATLNELTAGTIGMALPKARFIRIRRDPRDLAWSVFKHRYRKARHWTYHASDIAKILALHDRLCARWETLFGDRMTTVSYENLASDPATVIGELARFAGTDPAAAAARASETAGPLLSDPPGQAERIGPRFETLEAALQREGLV